MSLIDPSSRSESGLAHRGGLFETALGRAAYRALPPLVRGFHDRSGPAIWSGCADIDGKESIVSSLARRLIGLPEPGRNIAVRVSLSRAGTHEIWSRTFADRSFSSRLQQGEPGHVIEIFGALAFALALTPDADGLVFQTTRCRLAGVALPRWLAPRAQAREYQDNRARFAFEISLSLPFFGPLVHYRGWFLPESFINHGIGAEAKSVAPG